MVAVGIVGLLLSTQMIAASCEEITVFGPEGGRHVEFFDFDGSGGLSAGDKRIGRRVLEDSSGAAIGAKLHIAEVLETNDQGQAVKGFTHFFFVLPEGEIFSTMAVDQARADAADTSRPALDLDLRRITNIIGGTGIYEGATGTVEYVYDDGTGIYDVKARCLP
ncbi:hypothetical protein [Bauldia sp.]|uniref:hypothetical protein n=1 Tax=Bauldia sp. TaxID=2575872 RepID=UPI003BAA44E7